MTDDPGQALGTGTAFRGRRSHGRSGGAAEVHPHVWRPRAVWWAHAPGLLPASRGSSAMAVASHLHVASPG